MTGIASAISAAHSGTEHDHDPVHGDLGEVPVDPSPGVSHNGHGSGPVGDGGSPPWTEMLTDWDLAAMPLVPLIVGGVLLAGYAAGVVTLRRRGDRWSWLRCLSWVSGVVSLWVVTLNGIGAYGMVLFSVHMVQHMVIGMMTPVLLVAGAPLTLALRALPVRSTAAGMPRRWLLTIVHSRLAHVACSPVVTVGMFLASLYGLYFTPLLNTAMATHLGHYLMLGHFLLVGLLFYGPILAIDPWPRRSPAGLRLLEMLVVVPFHAFFGIAVMTSSTVLSSQFAEATRALGVDPIEDQSLGGGIAWALGEIPVVLVTTLVFIHWVREDQRTARRVDRQAERDNDAALAAYNRALERLGDPVAPPERASSRA